jgi:hypothetical protein
VSVLAIIAALGVVAAALLLSLAEESNSGKPPSHPWLETPPDE